jgi:hypothetical protein
VMAYQFMQTGRGQHTIREKDVSIRGQLRRLLPVGQAGKLLAAGGGGRGVGAPDSGDSGAAPLAVWQSAGTGSPVAGLREAGEPEEGGPVNAGERLERPAKGKVHPDATNSNHGLPVCASLMNREFHAEQSGQKWVSDNTYLRTNGG